MARLDPFDEFRQHNRKIRDSLIEAPGGAHELPGCSNIVHIARHTIQLGGKDIPFEEVTVAVKVALPS